MKIFCMLILTVFMVSIHAAEVSTDCSGINQSRQSAEKLKTKSKVKGSAVVRH